MLIEVRMGPEKRKIKELIADIRQKCRLPDGKTHRVPHLTIYGNFTLENGSYYRIRDFIARTSQKYGPLSFSIEGIETRRATKGYVVALKIIPSLEMQNFKNEIVRGMLNLAPRTKEHDRKGGWFHITLAYKLTKNELDRVLRYFNEPEAKESFFTGLVNLVFGNKCPEQHRQKPYFIPHVLRVTLLNDKAKIDCEYDLLQKKFLTRPEALTRSEWQKTLNLYRKYAGYDVRTNNPDSEDKTYIISDMHFDHMNIIKYCARPFTNVDEMNDCLLKNWNKTIKPTDKVYFLGDMAFGRGSRPSSFWLKLVNGRVTYIRGNHENIGTQSEVLDFKGRRFLLVHDPKEHVGKFDGWIIHGHKHNSDLFEYPFIDGKKKTINVSVEVIGYKPLSLEYLVSLDLDKIKRMTTVDSKAEYF